jgi:hypothetical protein
MHKASLFVAAAVLVLGAEANTPTADELVQKNIEARGGLDKLHSIKSLRMTGTMSLGNEAAAPTILEFVRPSKVRWEFTVDRQTAIQAYDGKTGWVILPFSGDTEPHEMSAEDRKGIALQADIDGPLVDAEKKGNKIALIGRQKPDGRDAWKLKITTSEGEERFVFLDAKTYLQFLTVTERTVDGRKMEVVNRIGDYRDVDGVKLPHSFEAGAEGVPESQVLHFDKIEVNVPIEDSRFAMPSKKGEK